MCPYTQQTHINSRTANTGIPLFTLNLTSYTFVGVSWLQTSLLQLFKQSFFVVRVPPVDHNM